MATHVSLKINYSERNRKELITMCREREIKGYTKKNKEELIEMLVKNDNGVQANVFIDKISVSTSNIDVDITKDAYTEELLKEQYSMHKSYVNGRINTTIKIGVKVRLPSIPEDISENIIKYIIRNKLHDTTTRWDCKNGDLQSQKEGTQECKCFTSDGPPSFTPSSDWDVIYFLDARKWLFNDKFILYRIPLKRTSTEWKNIKVNKNQTFEDQTKQGRRPRITWESLQSQIQTYCNKIYEGTFEDIFTTSY